jgi:hypothetical protein
MRLQPTPSPERAQEPSRATATASTPDPGTPRRRP